MRDAAPGMMKGLRIRIGNAGQFLAEKTQKLQGAKNTFAQSAGAVGQKLTSIGNMRIPGLDKIGPYIIKGMSKLPMVGKMAPLEPRVYQDSELLLMESWKRVPSCMIGKLTIKIKRKDRKRLWQYVR